MVSMQVIRGTARRWGAKLVETKTEGKTRVMGRTSRRHAAVVGTARRRAAPVGTAPYDISDERKYRGVRLKPHEKYIRISISSTCPIVSLDGTRWPPPPRGAFWKDQLWLTRSGRLKEFSVLIKNTLTKNTTLYVGPMTRRVISARPTTRRLKSGGLMTWRAVSARRMKWRATTATSTAPTAELIKRKTNKDV